MRALSTIPSLPAKTGKQFPLSEHNPGTYLLAAHDQVPWKRIVTPFERGVTVYFMSYDAEVHITAKPGSYFEGELRKITDVETAKQRAQMTALHDNIYVCN
jgi:hypothetical protein